MNEFAEIPYGYRWVTSKEKDEYIAAHAIDNLTGWMLELATVNGATVGYIRPLDCMLEFGFEHEHDTARCERALDIATFVEY